MLELTKNLLDEQGRKRKQPQIYIAVLLFFQRIHAFSVKPKMVSEISPKNAAVTFEEQF